MLSLRPIFTQRSRVRIVVVEMPMGLMLAAAAAVEVAAGEEMAGAERETIKMRQLGWTRKRQRG